MRLVINETKKPTHSLSQFDCDLEKLVRTTPTYLAKHCKAALSSDMTELSSKFRPEFYRVDKERLNLWARDLAFIQQAVCHQGWSFSEGLRIALKRISTYLGRLPVYLYEDCTLNNPLLSCPRLFSVGPASASELYFLKTHVEIEHELSSIIQRINYILEHHSELSLDLIINHLKKIPDALQHIGTYFSNLRSMPSNHFKAFRNYYGSLPNTTYLGPSGRFSAKFFSTMILINGKDILKVIPEYFDELLIHENYFPKHDFRQLKILIKKTNSADIKDANYSLRQLNQTLMIRHKEIDTLINSIAQTLDRILGVHFGLVQKYLVKESL